MDIVLAPTTYNLSLITYCGTFRQIRIDKSRPGLIGKEILPAIESERVIFVVSLYYFIRLVEKGSSILRRVEVSHRAHPEDGECLVIGHLLRNINLKTVDKQIEQTSAHEPDGLVGGLQRPHSVGGQRSDEPRIRAEVAWPDGELAGEQAPA